MNGRGKIFTYSIVYSEGDAFKEKTPYVIAVVEEAERKRTARVEGYTGETVVGVGTEVEFVSADDNGNSVYRFVQ